MLDSCSSDGGLQLLSLVASSLWSWKRFRCLMVNRMQKNSTLVFQRSDKKIPGIFFFLKASICFKLAGRRKVSFSVEDFLLLQPWTVYILPRPRLSISARLSFCRKSSYIPRSIQLPSSLTHDTVNNPFHGLYCGTTISVCVYCTFRSSRPRKVFVLTWHAAEMIRQQRSSLWWLITQLPSKQRVNRQASSKSMKKKKTWWQLQSFALVWRQTHFLSWLTD